MYIMIPSALFVGAVVLMVISYAITARSGKFSIGAHMFAVFVAMITVPAIVLLGPITSEIVGPYLYTSSAVIIGLISAIAFGHTGIRDDKKDYGRAVIMFCSLEVVASAAYSFALFTPGMLA